MRSRLGKATIQIVVILGVFVACFAAIVWIRSRRPQDPPIVRGASIFTPVTWERLEPTAKALLVRTYQGVAAPRLIFTLRAKVGGTLYFTLSDLDPGTAVRSCPSLRAADRSASAKALDGARAAAHTAPLTERERAAALIAIDPHEYHLRSELARERARQAELDQQARAAELERSEKLDELARTNLELTRRYLERLQGRLGAEEGLRGGAEFSEQAIEDAVKQVGSSEGNAASARANLVVAGKAVAAAAAAVAVARTEADLAARQERDCWLFSPVDAYVSKRLLVRGTAVLPGAAVLELVAIDRLRVRVQVPSDVYALFGPRTRAQVSFPAFRAAGIRAAELVDAEPLIETASRSVPVEFLVDNPRGCLATRSLDGRLPAGIACEVRIELDTVDGALWVDERHVVRSEEGAAVFAIESEERDDQVIERVVRVPISLGFYQDGRYQIPAAESPALHAGQRIATSNLDVLHDGDRVQPAAEMGSEPR